MANKIVNKNFFKRVLTTLILTPIVLYINAIGGILFDLSLVIILSLSAFEVISIVNNAKQMPIHKKLIWIIPILIYIIFSLVSLRYVRFTINNGDTFILYLLICIWSFDITAYLVGTVVGGPKLLPKISPKKTWSGLIGGCVMTFLLSFFMTETIKNNSSYNFVIILITILICITGQVGDIMESYFKRKFAVKDSSSILPGHGGILDRLDSIFLAAILFALILKLSV